jgi:hypothetical protein
LNECYVREIPSIYKTAITNLKGRHNLGRLYIDGRICKSVPVTGHEGP